MTAKGSDLERWAQPVNLAAQWDARANRAGVHIPAGVRVLDIGCGSMALRRALKPGCVYVPADIVEREPGCMVIDLNRQEFPPCSYDWVTLLGVLEYIHDPAWALQKAHEAASNLLLTYCVDTANGKAVSERRGMGWVNDFDPPGIRELLKSARWAIAGEMLDKRGAYDNQMMFVCHHNRIRNPSG